MTDNLKLKLISIGDSITYKHEGETLQGCVHGWHLCNNGYEHHVIVGSARYEHEVSLKSITKRERLAGAEQGLIVF